MALYFQLQFIKVHCTVNAKAIRRSVKQYKNEKYVENQTSNIAYKRVK